MRDSVTYMAILEEGMEKGVEKGRLEELKKMILRFGKKVFGPPQENVTVTLTSIDDVDRLELLHDRLADVKTWEDLLATP